MSNRLELDFSLPTAEERKKFLDHYIKTLPNPTEKELETCANYLLWGKDPETGKNPVQDREIIDPSGNSIWKKTQPESLEDLLENSFFSETLLRAPGEFVATTKPREVFSRAEAREKAPQTTLQVLEDLWRRIDTLDLELNYYELLNGKRNALPRAELEDRFDQETQEQLLANVENWTPRTYTKKKRYLVELRREQYTLRDTYSPVIRRRTFPIASFSGEVHLEIFPAGDPINFPYLFKPFLELNPKNLTEKEKTSTQNFIQTYYEKDPDLNVFDFCNPEHIYHYLTKPFYIPEIESALLYYINEANLTDIQKVILSQKVKGTTNLDISNLLRREYKTSYTENYISTLFTKKIIPLINEAAIYHLKVLENLSNENAFKACRTCGRILLISSDNYSRRARSKDGFSNRCKDCDREDRRRK